MSMSRRVALQGRATSSSEGRQEGGQLLVDTEGVEGDGFDELAARLTSHDPRGSGNPLPRSAIGSGADRWRAISRCSCAGGLQPSTKGASSPGVSGTMQFASPHCEVSP